MKPVRRHFDIFNMSFLDIISCGFGAVVLLVLISRTDPEPARVPVTDVENLLSQIIALELTTEDLEGQITAQQQENENQMTNLQALNTAAQTLEDRLGLQETENKTLDSSLTGLALVQDSLKRISITPSTIQTSRDEEVGGIPVDSDHVIFIVDTSGSMLDIWDRVSREVLNVLSIHPKVTAFQILNDQGESLISAYNGKWIPDTPKRRENVMRVFDKWVDYSNSSPIEGIETALKRYAKPNTPMSVYVFGDDYTGDSYDAPVEQLTRLNAQKGNVTRIHAVGFISPNTTDRFAVLMREITKRNNGTFIALPR